MIRLWSLNSHSCISVTILSPLPQQSFPGTVTLWSPNQHSPLVKMLCHRGPITGLAIDWGGWYLATAGMDSKLKLWDVRTYKALHWLPSRRPAASLDISQRGLLVLGRGREVQVWRDALGDRPKVLYRKYRPSLWLEYLQQTSPSPRHPTCSMRWRER